MQPFIKSVLCIFWLLVSLDSTASASHTGSSHNLKAKDEVTVLSAHGFALYDDLKYPKGFKHFDFVNPQAPKGGTLQLMGFGSFDSLNPYTLKNTSPFNTPGQFMYGFSELNETLLTGTGSYDPLGDEPQSAYGLIAESLSYPEDIAWVSFTLRDEAHFHDGHSIDADDVVFSFETLLKHGHPRFQQSLLNIAKVEAVSPKQVKFVFKDTGQRASILRAGELPILAKHFWEDRDFEASSNEIPLLSGPYKVAQVELGKRVTLERVPDFWAKSLNVYRGRYNFDKVIIDYYRDQTVAFEAFKAGNFDLYYDYTAKNWAKAYDFPALNAGKVRKRQISHQIPSGTQGFFFNTRQPKFADKRVREAISLMFDFEWSNKNLFNDAYKRNETFYPNSDFASRSKPSSAELTLLEPLRKHLPNELFTQAFFTPKTRGNGRIREQVRTATKLLESAGWALREQKLIHSSSSEPFSFEILIRQPGLKRVILPFVKNLEKLGIDASVRLVDATQYKVMLDNFDYDMTTFVLPQGQAPSFEQRDYYHSSTANQVGSRNYAGIENPAVDALLEHVLSADSRASLVNAMRALDRTLLWEHYIIPNWHLDYHRLAHWDRFDYPKTQPPYTLGIENWWAKDASQ